ncbi:hypothetical protein [Amycolatopsis taiwanensis]|uniref:hypothetical protein n=1 Tax=Amycolatopsis taiwanensis TaxID=342230 RepID=UPI000485AC49|nr:hypothetical protein [Amycolatopsis taiwanensis]
MALVYATRDELVEYAPADVKTRIPNDPEATRLLTSASAEVLSATKTAIYDADAEGYPSDTTVRQAFRNATCAQAVWWLTGGDDEQGASSQYQTVSIGSLTLARSQPGTATPPSTQRLAPRAAVELDGVGIALGVVVTWA